MTNRLLLLILVLISLGAEARQVQIVHGYIEPPCPLVTDDVIVREFFSQRLNLTARQGNTFTLISDNPPCTSGPCTTNASAVLGRLEAGTYTINILAATNGQLKTSFEFSVGLPVVDHTGAWSQPSSSGHGVGLFRSGRYVSGAFYSYLTDNRPVWLLMQMANCTSTGYRGALTYYQGNHWSNSAIPAQSNLSADKTPMILTGIWRFDLPNVSEGTLSYTLGTNPIPLGAAGYDPVTTVRPMQKL